MQVMGRGIGLRKLFVSHVSWYVVQKKKIHPDGATWRRGLLTTAHSENDAPGETGERANKFSLWVIPLGANEEKKNVQGTAKLQCTIFSATDIAAFSNVELLEHSNTYKASQPVWDAHQCLPWQAKAAILLCFCKTSAEQWAKRWLSHISSSVVLAGPKHDCSTVEWHCVPKNSTKDTLCDGFCKPAYESQVSVQHKFMEWPDAISCALKIDESVVGKRGSFAIMYRPCSWHLQSLHTTMYHTSLCALIASSSASGNVPIVPVSCCHGNKAQRVAQHKSDSSYYQCPFSFFFFYI